MGICAAPGAYDEHGHGHAGVCPRRLTLISMPLEMEVRKW
jgi:hypothetical protein